jgi:putative nucleotidyltransferase with HDIG domain
MLHLKIGELCVSALLVSVFIMLKRIPVTELRLGMYIHKFCGSWVDHSFWKASFLLKNQSELQRIIRSNVSELWIDTDKGSGICEAQSDELSEECDTATQAPAQVTEGFTQPRVSMQEEIAQALKLCSRSKAAVVEMFGDLRMGRAIELEGIGELVEDISNSLLRNSHALISVARLKQSDEYTYMHSVAVCGLMIALARQLGLSAEQVKEAGMAGLLHDVGKMAIPTDILNKPGKLSDTEFDTVRGHPEAGKDMLLGSRHFSSQVLDVCLHHHEKYDGSGYPHRLTGEQISLFARMGAICDVYDAITSDRPYKKGWCPADSIRQMAEWSGHFDKKILQAFVKCIGIYPVGTLVRLESGRIGVVIEQHDNALLTPKVKVFFSARSRLPIEQTVVDLAKRAGEDRIVSRERVEDWGFKGIEELWSGLEASKTSYFDPK